MSHTRATARRWAAYYRTHSMRATADHFGVSHNTVALAFALHTIPVRDKAFPSPAVALMRKAKRAAKLRALADAAEG